MYVANWINASEEVPSVSGVYKVYISGEGITDLFYLRKGEEVLMKRTPSSFHLGEKVLYLLNKVSLLILVPENGFYKIEKDRCGEILKKMKSQDVKWSSLRTSNEEYLSMKRTITEYKKERELNWNQLKKEYELEVKKDKILSNLYESLEKQILCDEFIYAGVKFKASKESIQKSCIEAILLNKMVDSIKYNQSAEKALRTLFAGEIGEVEEAGELKSNITAHLQSFQYPAKLIDYLSDSLFSFVFSSRKEDIVKNLYSIEGGVQGTKMQESMMRALLKYNSYNSIRRMLYAKTNKGQADNEIFEFNCMRDIAFYFTLQKSQIIEFTTNFEVEMELED